MAGTLSSPSDGNKTSGRMDARVTLIEQTPDSARRGRPPGTSARELELIALRLFTEHGFEQTTVEQIAAAAGVSRRTFFRYYDTKADVLWHDFDNEVQALRAAFARIPDKTPLMTAIRQAVVGVNRYAGDERPEAPPSPDFSALAAKQVERLRRLRAARDAGRVQITLDGVTAAAHRAGAPLMEPIVEAVRARATVGEITAALEVVWGRHGRSLTG